MKKEPTYYSGDVVTLPANSKVLLNRAEIWTTQAEKDVVVEAARQIDPGLRSDHFKDGEVIDCRPLNDDGTYNPQAPLYTVALSGDFAPELIVRLGDVTKKLKKTYVPA